jgi:hypothetical protein
MGSYRPLRFVFFIYDFVRLVVMTSLLMGFVQLTESQDGGVFPYVFYAVPNGLFPLMSFFLWVDPGAYRPFIPLYMAGKVLAVVSGLMWIIFSLPRISGAFFETGQSTFIVAGTALLLSAGDAFSALGGAVLRKHSPDAAPPREQGRAPALGAANPGAAEASEEGN